jgi:histidinol-phosphatase (PHP family)
MLTTFHTHSLFCDGGMMPENYIKSAVRKGFSAIGISSHAPVFIDTHWNMKAGKLKEYITNIQNLKEKYRGKIQIYLGLETDYYPGCTDYRNYPGIDYTIGSVHFFRHCAANNPLPEEPVQCRDDALISDSRHSFCKHQKTKHYEPNCFSPDPKRSCKYADCYLAIDGTADEFRKTLDIGFSGNIRALVEKYYLLLAEMIEKQTPCILGHLDVLKKNNLNNRYFNEYETWYRSIVRDVLTMIRKHSVIVEVNTGGIARGYTKEMYPSDWILQLICEIEIPIMLNSDAHHPDLIDAYYAEAGQKLKSIGFTHQRILFDGIWQDVPLD